MLQTTRSYFYTTKFCHEALFIKHSHPLKISDLCVISTMIYCISYSKNFIFYHKVLYYMYMYVFPIGLCDHSRFIYLTALFSSLYQNIVLKCKSPTEKHYPILKIHFGDAFRLNKNKKINTFFIFLTQGIHTTIHKTMFE